jgi:hypothetical protein
VTVGNIQLLLYQIGIRTLGALKHQGFFYIIIDIPAGCHRNTILNNSFAGSLSMFIGEVIPAIEALRPGADDFVMYPFTGMTKKSQ